MRKSFNVCTRTIKKARFRERASSRLEFAKGFSGFAYFCSFATRLDRRDTFRDPVFLCRMPLETPRMISGSAAFRAARAAALSPLVMASSTLRIKPRTRVVRAVLIAVRLAAVRTRFLDEAILGMDFPWQKRRAYSPAKALGQQNPLFLLGLAGGTVKGRASGLDDAFDGPPAP